MKIDTAVSLLYVQVVKFHIKHLKELLFIKLLKLYGMFACPRDKKKFNEDKPCFYKNLLCELAKYKNEVKNNPTFLGEERKTKMLLILRTF